MKILFAVLLLAGLTNCSKKIECTDPEINLAFVSFSPNELDTVIIRKFAKNNNFQTPINTIQLTSGMARNTTRGDTTYIFINYPEDRIMSGFDWQVFIPAANRTLTISHIVTEDKTGKCAMMATYSNCFCNDKLVSLSINNQNASFESYPTYTAFIKR